MSSYIEASGSAQTVGNRANIVFDIGADELDIAGSDITVDATGTVFTITRAGLYHVEWSVNLQSGTQPILLCLMENGGFSSAIANIATNGNYSSGALINVGTADVPYTISLYNFGGPIALTGPTGLENTAASIRILRFADGPTV